jgi:hypothetical protein
MNNKCTTWCLEKKEQYLQKNGILDILGSDYRKSLDGTLSSDKIHIVS